jgi:TRAP-type mannitol/chloroaromatic compound transport system substrate-binding protein
MLPVAMALITLAGILAGYRVGLVLAGLRKAADEVYEENAAKDPMFRKVIDSYRAYSRVYDEYRRLNQLD